MRDATHNAGAIGAIPAAVYSADANGATIDRLGYDSLTFILSLGVGGITFTNNNRVDFIVEHSDDALAWSAAEGTNIVGGAVDSTGIFKSLTAAAPSPVVSRIGYVDGTPGSKRYVRLRLDFGGTHGTGTPIDAIALLGRARQKPVA